MKISALLSLLLVQFIATSAFAQNDYIEFQRILNTKCTECHPRARIEQAMRRGENLDLITAKMLRFGARISEQDQQVLGIFWPADSADKRPASTPLAEDPLGEYRATLESRCTGCHSLERVEEAMRQQRSPDALVEMMRQRGAIIPPSEQKVLGTFWGKPYKQKLPQ